MTLPKQWSEKAFNFLQLLKGFLLGLLADDVTGLPGGPRKEALSSLESLEKFVLAFVIVVVMRLFLYGQPAKGLSPSHHAIGLEAEGVQMKRVIVCLQGSLHVKKRQRLEKGTSTAWHLHQQCTQKLVTKMISCILII